MSKKRLPSSQIPANKLTDLYLGKNIKPKIVGSKLLGNYMTVRWTILAAFCGTFAISPSKAVVISVAPGESCRADSVGSHVCQWLDESGSITGRANLLVRGSTGPRQFPSFSFQLDAIPDGLGLVLLPLSGMVNVVLPYEMLPYPGYWGFNRFNGSTGRGVSSNFRKRTQIDFEFETGFANDPGGLAVFGGRVNSPIYYRPNASRATGLPEGDYWKGSVKWTIQQGVAYSHISLGSNFVVPEPATWAMFIVGFGTVGAAVRRRRRLDSKSCTDSIKGLAKEQ